MEMIYIITAILAMGVCYLSARLLFLKKSVKDTKKQLEEINQYLEENRIVTLSAPDKEFEALLVEINHTLQEVRLERVMYDKREKEFKQQIENISHDLRTPLTSMIGYLKIMDASGLNEEEQADLQTVLRKAERLQELITQFYDFSRLTAQDYPLDLESVDVTKTLREALADAYGELAGRQLEVWADIPEKAVCIMANEKALQRVFQNLLQNAGKYAVSRLDVSVKAEDEKLEICFANDVEDMDTYDVERLFERFYTLDSSRNSGSTGLGLTIAKEFVEKMKGSIEADLEDKKLYIRLLFAKKN
ncbi:MAG: HAMP domain-containing histidine kinase [Lachnospiraceae bacterium]|nr:HAMP domain-containing histidine kinase [Lachnospiraceae bacterium]